jgi:hypothetical protein
MSANLQPGAGWQEDQLVAGAPAAASAAALATPVTIAADGTVSAAVTANGTAGHYAVTAGAAGVSGSPSFALTNVAVANALPEDH